jgi:hypothetical protein
MEGIFMKKQVRNGLVSAGFLLAGFAIGWATGAPNGIHVTDGAKYQYQVIDPNDIIIEYSGLKPDQNLAKYKGKYVTDTSVYLSNQVGVYLGEDHYTATVGEYVQYTDINWKWDSNNNWDMFISTRNGVTEGDASMFEGIIDYADGTQSSVTADSVELGFEDNGNTEVVSIKFRDDTYTYKFAIPESWWDEGDGSELSAEDLEALRGQDTDMTQDGSSTADYVYSLKDVPELTNVDWDLFNKYASVNLHNDGNLFSFLGKDVRVDWSLVNDSFNQYYGNTEEGMLRFFSDLFETYEHIKGTELDNVGTYGDSDFYLQPINDKIANGDYDDITKNRRDQLWSDEDYCYDSFISVIDKDISSEEIPFLGDVVIIALEGAKERNMDGLLFNELGFEYKDLESACRFGKRLFNGIDSTLYSNHSDLYGSFVDYINTGLSEDGLNMTYDDIKAMCN